MRRAEEEKVWSSLKKSRIGDSPRLETFGKVSVDLAQPCLVLGGRNGSGKSRLLRAIADRLGDESLLLDLHSLCEQALSTLRSRGDFQEMTDEFEAFGPDDDRFDDLKRIIGRDYDSVEWYALEIDPSDASVAERFRWGGDQATVPYFNAQHRNLVYPAVDMGLGEFSIHLLLWILEQYRDEKGLTLLLDEPDAYLPPVGASALLVRLNSICLSRGWRLVISTHSYEMIADALKEDAFILLRTNEAGDSVATHCRDDHTVADILLTRPPLRHVIFVEDESAWILSRILVEELDRSIAAATAVVWGNGSGYMAELQEHFPRTPASEISYAYLFDGDKRSEIGPSKSGKWPALFLPTACDPDDLFKTLSLEVNSLALRLNVPEGELARFLESKEGLDSHDWVNDFGVRYGRPQVLRVLAELWVQTNGAEVASFLRELKGVL